MKIVIFVILISVFLAMNADTTTSDWIPNYVTNQVNKVLYPITIQQCNSVKYFKNNLTNEITLDQVNQNDKLLVLFDIPNSVLPPVTNSGAVYSENAIGYYIFTVTGVSAPVSVHLFKQN